MLNGKFSPLGLFAAFGTSLGLGGSGLRDCRQPDRLVQHLLALAEGISWCTILLLLFLLYAYMGPGNGHAIS